MPTTAYLVQGMTCGHCIGAVTQELTGIDGVSGVEVDLDAGGSSCVRVTSVAPLTDAQVGAALAEAGDYRLVSCDA